MPKLRYLFPFLIIAIAIYSSVQPLKGLLSQQDPISPSSLTGDFDDTAAKAEFHGISLAPPPSTNSRFLAAVLGDNDAKKRIDVDLDNQKLYAYQGDQKVYEFPISSGKWYPTPTGTFQIWGKYRYIKMSGGNQAIGTYYYLPNVPYVMFFSNDKVSASRGFSLHGTYWHNNFGHPMSHGCVNMRTEDAGTIFYWSSPTVGDQKTAKASSTSPGTTIVIYGTAPEN